MQIGTMGSAYGNTGVMSRPTLGRAVRPVPMPHLVSLTGPGGDVLGTPGELMPQEPVFRIPTLDPRKVLSRLRGTSGRALPRAPGGLNRVHAGEQAARAAAVAALHRHGMPNMPIDVPVSPYATSPAQALTASPRPMQNGLVDPGAGPTAVDDPVTALARLLAQARLVQAQQHGVVVQ